MSTGSASYRSGDEKFTSVVLIGGRDCRPNAPLSTQNPDLWVQGGSIIEKTLCVLGNISSPGVITSSAFCGDILTNEIISKDLNTPIDIIGDVNFDENFTVTVPGDLVVNNFTVTGNVTGNISGGTGNISGDFSVSGKTTTGELCVTGDAEVAGELTVNDLVVLGNVSGNIMTDSGNIAGDFTVAGKTTLNELCVTGDAVIQGNLLASMINIIGNCILAQDGVTQVCVTNGIVDIVGETTIDGNLTLSGGKITAQELCITGLSMLSETTIDGNILVNGNLTVTDDLNAQGKITGEELCVTGATMLSDTSIDGNLTFTQGKITGEELCITGETMLTNTSIDGNLDSQGKITGLELCISGDAIFEGNVVLNGNLTNDIDLNCNDILNVMQLGVWNISTACGGNVVRFLDNVDVNFNSILNVDRTEFSDGIQIGDSLTSAVGNSIVIGQNSVALTPNTIVLGNDVTGNVQGGFFVAHRGPIATVVNAAGFLAGTNELVEVTSSRRFKTDIRDLETVSEKIDQLRPVRYRPKEGHGDDREHIGFIAEEVNEIFPEFVTYDSTGTVTGMMFDRMTSVIFKELQSVRRRLAELEAAHNVA